MGGDTKKGIRMGKGKEQGKEELFDQLMIMILNQKVTKKVISRSMVKRPTPTLTLTHPERRLLPLETCFTLQ